MRDQTWGILQAFPAYRSATTAWYAAGALITISLWKDVWYWMLFIEAVARPSQLRCGVRDHRFALPIQDTFFSILQSSKVVLVSLRELTLLLYANHWQYSKDWQTNSNQLLNRVTNFELIVKQLQAGISSVSSISINTLVLCYFPPLVDGAPTRSVIGKQINQVQSSSL